MRNTLFLVVAAWMAAQTAVMAGGACCASMKVPVAVPEQKAMSPEKCKAICDQLELTEEQKVKVNEILSACPAEGCKPEDMEKCMKALGEVLTPEQMEQFKGACGTVCGAKAPVK